MTPAVFPKSNQCDGQKEIQVYWSGPSYSLPVYSNKSNHKKVSGKKTHQSEMNWAELNRAEWKRTDRTEREESRAERSKRLMQCRCSAAQLTRELIQEGRKKWNMLQLQEKLVRTQIYLVYLLLINIRKKERKKEWCVRMKVTVL